MGMGEGSTEGGRHGVIQGGRDDHYAFYAHYVDRITFFLLMGRLYIACTKYFMHFILDLFNSSRFTSQRRAKTCILRKNREGM
jgi:hypothetical protein